MLSQSATVIIIIIIIIIITIIIIVISLRSGLMLFPGKKCHNSGHQPFVLGIEAFFFHFISNTFRIILTLPSELGF